MKKKVKQESILSFKKELKIANDEIYRLEREKSNLTNENYSLRKENNELEKIKEQREYIKGQRDGMVNILKMIGFQTEMSFNNFEEFMEQKRF